MNEPLSGVRGLRGVRLRLRRPGLAQLGWIAGAVGALLCVLGWYGISGERYAERQLPYLASATIPGAALVVAGAMLLARPGAAEEEARRERVAGDEELRRQLTLLYDLLVEEASRAPQGENPATAAAAPERLLYLPNGRTYHRADCLLVEGRGDALPVTPAGARERGLRPCPLCAPDREAPSGRQTPGA
jgi:hypothetical protein